MHDVDNLLPHLVHAPALRRLVVGVEVASAHDDDDDHHHLDEEPGRAAPPAHVLAQLLNNATRLACTIRIDAEPGKSSGVTAEVKAEMRRVQQLVESALELQSFGSRFTVECSHPAWSLRHLFDQ